MAKETKVARDVAADLLGDTKTSKSKAKKPVTKKAAKRAPVRRSQFADTAKIFLTSSGRERGTREGSNSAKIFNIIENGMTVAKYREKRSKLKIPGTGMPFLSYLVRKDFAQVRGK